MAADTPARGLRADARRNRARVLAVAAEVFAAEGLSVPVHEIARRAGVGTGTVSRHFPTKEDLFAAILLERMEHLTRQADELAATRGPGAAFFAFFAELAAQAGANLALSAAVTDSADAVREAAEPLAAALAVLLTRAQDAGAVRADITVTDLHAITAGALLAEQRLDPAARGRALRVVADGLRTRR